MRARHIAIEDAAFVAAGRKVDASLIRTRVWLITSKAARDADDWQREWEK